MAGYQWRGYALQGQKPPLWHARVWLMRRPWMADAQIGPTWNAYINGAGFWQAGGACSPFADRYSPALGDVALGEARPAGDVDLTGLFQTADPAELGRRLRTLEACGFLLHKAELFNREYGEKGICTGVARLWIRDPVLEIALASADRPAALPVLPEPVDPRKLAQELKASGRGGLPTTLLPDNIAAVARRRREKPADMPDWMWQRVRQVRELRTAHDANYFDFTLFDDLESGDRTRYEALVHKLLEMPPGWFFGHSHIDFMIPLLVYDDLLPDVLRYHLRHFFRTRWDPPYDRQVFNHGVGYFSHMATLNHQCQFRGEALLAAELLGLSDLAVRSRYGLSLLNRQMLYSEGTIQERGDTFYLGISLTTLQAAARWSSDPLVRLKASLGVEKMLFETNLTYHPGLRRRVSRINRRYRLQDFLLGQDAPEAILHTLSKKGVLIETDKLKVHDVDVFNFGSCPPDRVALLSPWGPPWESNVTDDKPLPFLLVSTDYVRGLLQEPILNTTYLGRNYGLASIGSDISSEYPVMAVWRRRARPVEKLDDLAQAFIWGYLNDRPMNPMHQDVTDGVRMNPLIGTLQHQGRLLYCMRAAERPFVEKAFKDGLTSLASRVSVYRCGPDRSLALWINGQRVEQFPARARAGDRITLQDGPSYLGLVALPATDLGRRDEVVIRHDGPHLSFDSYLLQADTPRPHTDELWQQILRATAGWVLELADQDEHGSFGAFQKHMEAAALQTRWTEADQTLHVTYRSGHDVLELGYTPSLVRDETWKPTPPSKVVRYVRVNGRDPRPARGLDLDCPLGQMGTSGLLEKAGASLRTVPGQMALLRVEPLSRTYEAINPFIDPVPLELTLPEGMTIRSDGPLGCARITVQPKANTLWVDYHLPPPEGDRAVELLQEEGRQGQIAGYYPVESLISRYFRPGVDVRHARRDSARALLVSGVSKAPRVILNGVELPGPFEEFTWNGRTCYRLRIAPEP